MHEGYPNIYKTARVGAGLTQERAAELLDVSVESVKAYETGVRLPPGGTVRRMAAVYDAPGLRLEHARLADDLDVIPAQALPRAFPLAVLALCNRLIEFEGRRRRAQLLRIAEDGAVDATEARLYGLIGAECEGLTAALLSLKFAQGIKNDRLDAGTSKRSSFQGEPQKHCTSIISGFPAERKPYFYAGEEVFLP